MHAPVHQINFSANILCHAVHVIALLYSHACLLVTNFANWNSVAVQIGFSVMNLSIGEQNEMMTVEVFKLRQTSLVTQVHLTATNITNIGTNLCL